MSTMATFSLPVTFRFWLGEWPWTSALGLSTRRRSAVRRTVSPSSNTTSSVRPLSVTVMSVGQAMRAPASDDADARGGLRPRSPGLERLRDAPGDLEEGAGVAAVGQAGHDGAPVVGIGADGDV